MRVLSVKTKLGGKTRFFYILKEDNFRPRLTVVTTAKSVSGDCKTEQRAVRATRDERCGYDTSVVFA